MQFKILLFPPLPFFQIPGLQALTNIKFPAPGKGLLSIARGDVEGSN